MPDNKKTGQIGEDLACKFLERKGYKILERNKHFSRTCEIDIIALDNKTLVFVEVKYRPRGKLGDGAEAVDARKQKRLRYAAACYLQTQPPCAARFDVIEISADGLRHLPNAF